MLNTHRPTCFRAAVATWFVLALLPALLAQDAVGTSVKMPEDLSEFWRAYNDARSDDDEEEMDKVVRRSKFEAEDCLGVLLADLSLRDERELHAEARTLAWSLDRVSNTERFIERVRLVIDLEQRDRRVRAEAFRKRNKGLELEEVARKERTKSAWANAEAQHLQSLEMFRKINDHESAVAALYQLQYIEYQRGQPWERAVYLDQLVEEGADLAFHEPLVDEAQGLLERLLADGIDPKQDKPADLDGAAGAEGGAADGAAGVSGGRSLTDYAEGSEDQTFELDFEAPKKGVGSVALPSFYPPDQPQLWPRTYVGNEGDPFDTQRLWFKPFGQEWQMSRDGTKFLVDSNGDGETDIDFTASTAPSRVEVPLAGDAGSFAVMVAVFSDRESMFDMDANYAPTVDGAWMRFGPASFLDGKVLGKPWKIYDSNLDGNFGPAQNVIDDGITIYDPDDSINCWEVDAVLVGRAKKAVPLSSVMHVDDAFYRTTLDAAKRQVTVRELDLQTGHVAVDIDVAVAPSHLVVREIGKLDGAFFDILPAKRGAQVELPVGEYELVMGRIAKGKKTSMDQVRIYKGRSPSFKIEDGQTTTLELGAPYTFAFKTKNAGKEVILDTLSLRAFGRGGEEYAMFFDDPLQPSVETQLGSKKNKPEKLRRAGIDEWQNKNNPRDNVMWFPVEFRVEKPKGGGDVKFRLTQKSHSLLGGPFESDWIP